MTDSPKSKKPRKKSGSTPKKKDQAVKPNVDGSGKITDTEKPSTHPLSGLLHELKGEFTGSALRAAAKAGGASLKLGKAMLLNPEQRKIVREAGRSLKDLRELAGMTQDEISDALKLKDTSLLKAVENGTATLSFELI